MELPLLAVICCFRDATKVCAGCAPFGLGASHPDVATGFSLLRYPFPSLPIGQSRTSSTIGFVIWRTRHIGHDFVLATVEWARVRPGRDGAHQPVPDPIPGPQPQQITSEQTK